MINLGSSEILSIGMGVAAVIGYILRELTKKLSKKEFTDFTCAHQKEHDTLASIIRENHDCVNKNFIRLSEQLGEIRGCLRKD